MNSVKFHLQIKDTEREAGIPCDAMEEIRVLVRIDSQFGASPVGKVKLAMSCRGKSANPSYAVCAQSGGPVGNIRSIPWVLLDIDEGFFTALSLQPCLLVLDSLLSSSKILFYFLNYEVISFKMNLAGDLIEVWKTRIVRLCTRWQSRVCSSPKMSSISLSADFDRNPSVGLRVIQLMYNSLPEDLTMLLSFLVAISFLPVSQGEQSSDNRGDAGAVTPIYSFSVTWGENKQTQYSCSCMVSNLFLKSVTWKISRHKENSSVGTFCVVCDLVLDRRDSLCFCKFNIRVKVKVTSLPSESIRFSSE